MARRLLASILDFNNKRGVNVGAPVADTDIARKVDIDVALANSRNRSTHTGTQTASTISDFDTQVRTSRLDQLTLPGNPVNFNTQRLVNLADPQSPQDAVTRSWVDQQLSGLAGGLVLKGTVRVAVADNISLASPGAFLDGVGMNIGDVALLFGQSNGTQNGPYVWHGESLSMTRAENWSSTSKATPGSFWVVLEGTRGDHLALFTNDNFTLGTDQAKFGFVNIVPGLGLPLEADLGNGTDTNFTLTHNFGTRAVHVSVFRNSAPYDEVTVYVSRPTLNTITIEPDDVWTTNQFHAIVSKA